MYHIEKKVGKVWKRVMDLKYEEDVVMFLEKKTGLRYAGSPYIFTCINLSDGSRLTQDNNGIVCSPFKMRDILKTL